MAVTILLANGEGDHNFSGGTDGPSRNGAFHDHRRLRPTTKLRSRPRRRGFSRLLNSKAMNDPVRNDLALLVVSMWQVTAEDNQTVKGSSG
jgi:hypothetical protein